MKTHDEELEGEEQDLDEGQEGQEGQEGEEGEEGEGGRLSGGVGFLSGLVIGALVGAGIALLVAPERGAVTRKRLRRKLRRLREGAADQMEDWANDAKRKLARQRRELRRLRRRAF